MLSSILVGDERGGIEGVSLEEGGRTYSSNEGLAVSSCGFVLYKIEFLTTQNLLQKTEVGFGILEQKMRNIQGGP